MKRQPSEAQIWLLDYLKERFEPLGVAVFAEYVFCERRWRFDAAVWGELLKLAFEIEGGLYVKGAHVRGQHYESDMEKYNRAAADGWKVFRWTPRQVLDGTAKAFIEKWL